MNKLQRLTDEIRSLNSGELASLRAWFTDFDGLDSSRNISAYLGTGQVGAAGAVIAPGGEPELTNEQADIAELAANICEAYRQVALSEYAHFIATDGSFMTALASARS